MPLLVDGGRPVAESSIIIEHLQRHHAAPGHALIPDAVDAALDVRLLAHPAVARAIDDARPFFQYYPGRAGLAARFLPAGA
jgi:glutathione S-transferase